MHHPGDGAPGAGDQGRGLVAVAQLDVEDSSPAWLDRGVDVRRITAAPDVAGILIVPSRRLEQMRANPRADWTIADVAAVCREYEIRCEPARGGSSHYKVFHSGVPGTLTVPFKRPIKPVYIRQLVHFIDEVRKLP